jgi:hypothetical protein
MIIAKDITGTAKAISHDNLDHSNDGVLSK